MEEGQLRLHSKPLEAASKPAKKHSGIYTVYIYLGLEPVNLFNTYA